MIRRFFYLNLLSLLIILLYSCSAEPQPITYGEDECARCKMIISDAQFGAELVTKKGKVYKYDAIECLIPALLENGEDHYAHVLVTDYHKPKEFIPAREASFLISKDLPSPMGAFLSAYETNDVANKAMAQYQGKVYDWTSILAHFNRD